MPAPAKLRLRNDQHSSNISKRGNVPTSTRVRVIGDAELFSFICLGQSRRRLPSWASFTGFLCLRHYWLCRSTNRPVSSIWRAMINVLVRSWFDVLQVPFFKESIIVPTTPTNIYINILPVQLPYCFTIMCIYSISRSKGFQAKETFLFAVKTTSLLA